MLSKRSWRFSCSSREKLYSDEVNGGSNWRRPSSSPCCTCPKPRGWWLTAWLTWWLKFKSFVRVVSREIKDKYLLGLDIFHKSATVEKCYCIVFICKKWMIRQIKHQSTKILGFFLALKVSRIASFLKLLFHAKMNDAWNKLAAKHKIISFSKLYANASTYPNTNSIIYFWKLQLDIIWHSN